MIDALSNTAIALAEAEWEHPDFPVRQVAKSLISRQLGLAITSCYILGLSKMDSTELGLTTPPASAIRDLTRAASVSQRTPETRGLSRSWARYDVSPPRAGRSRGIGLAHTSS